MTQDQSGTDPEGGLTMGQDDEGSTGGMQSSGDLGRSEAEGPADSGAGESGMPGEHDGGADGGADGSQ